jgi:RNA polymerase sigma-70 factor, ECF subfamily
VSGELATGKAGRPESAPSFEALLTPLLESAYGTALRLTRNSADAEDLVQDAAFLAARGFRSFEAGTNFRAWFFRILINSFYSKYRRQKREGTPVELEDTPELYLYSRTAAAGLHGATPDPAAALMDRLDGEAVTRAIDALPEEYRVVATLYFMQDLPYQEIADVLAVPVGTVRSRLHRGRRLLQKALWTIAEERGIVPGPGAKGGQDE